MGGIITYIAATAVINFFIPNDTQLVYIMETADENKRGTMYSIIKSIATVSVMLIPLMRKAFMGDDVTKWENVYIVPMLLALVAAVMCFITAREPDVFLHNRIAYLKMSDEEKEALKNAKDASQEKGGLGKAFKFAFSHKQLRWLFIVAAIWGLGALAIQYYGRIMANYYSTEEVTSALMMYPITCALMMLLNGSVGDRIGRKPVVVGMAAISFVSFGVLFLACNNHWSPIVAGLLLGSYIGAFYSAGDNISSLMTGESAPTNMRASVMSAQSVVNIISKMFAMIVPLVALFITKDNYAVLGLLCVFGSLPAMFVSLFFLITKVGDTSHVNLDTVKGDEWDNK